MSMSSITTDVPLINGHFLTGYLARSEFGGLALGHQLAASGESRPEVIQGESSLLPFHFLRTGDRLGRSVVKIRRGDGGCGTGFLVAPDILMTNHHVLPSASLAALAVAVADYETAPAHGGLRATPFEVALAPDRLFLTGADLDFTFCSVKGLEGRGAIELNRSESAAEET